MTRATLHHLTIEGTEYLLVGVPLGAEGEVALTAAERVVAELVAAGLTTAQIAKKRHTSVATVVNQLGAIYKKLGVSGRVGLVAWLAR